MIDIFSELKKDFNKKFVKPRYVDDLDLGLFWGWIIENFVPVEAIVRQGAVQPVLLAEDLAKCESLVEELASSFLDTRDNGDYYSKYRTDHQDLADMVNKYFNEKVSKQSA